MLYSEFVGLAGVDVPADVYDNVIEPMYMATDMDKLDFVDFIRPSLKRYVIKPRLADTVLFVTHGNERENGEKEGHFVKLLHDGMDIRTGRHAYWVRKLSDREWFELSQETDMMFQKEGISLGNPGVTFHDMTRNGRAF